MLEAWAPGATTDRVVQVEHEIADPAFIVLVAEAAGDLTGFAGDTDGRRVARGLSQARPGRRHQPRPAG